MWDHCGMSRNEEGLLKARDLVAELEKEFWSDLAIPGKPEDLNMELEKAGRIADYFELAQLMITDALNRKESCGAHFREESQTPEGEAMRDDENFMYVAAWEFTGDPKAPAMHREDLVYEEVEVKVRSYK